MLNRNVHFVVFRYGHHASHSGYSRLAEYGAKQFNGEIIQVNKPLPRALIRDRLYWSLAAGTPGYDRSSMAAELSVAWHILKESRGLYHYLYGETTYHYTGNLNNIRQNRLLATFHLPPDGLRAAVQMSWHLQQLSGIICVGHNQQEYFSGFVNHVRTFFVPLGVDTEYYTPPVEFQTRNPNLCLVVGENYRDYPTLRGVIELVSFLRPQTQFVVISPPATHPLLGLHPNLTLRSRVPEPEFLELYRTAALLVMPLHEATANNAILEGLACGVPMVVTDVGAIRDYVSPECVALVPVHNARAMAEVVLGLLDDTAQRTRLAARAREQALKFSWPSVIGQLERVYQAIE